MKKLHNRQLWLASALMLAVVWAWVSPVGADPQNLNRLLRGDYAFTGEAACLVSPIGFSPDFIPLPVNPTPPPLTLGPSFIRSFTIKGIRTYNGDGTGTAHATGTQIFHPGPGQGPRAAEFEVDVKFDYNVSPDRSFTLETTSVTGTVTAGLGTGSTFAISPLHFTGHMSKDRKTLVLTTKEPDVEIHTFFTPPDPTPTGQDFRICHRSRVDIKIKPQEDD